MNSQGRIRLTLKQTRWPARCSPMLLAALALAVLPGCSGSDSGAVTAAVSATVQNTAQTVATVSSASDNGAGATNGNAADAGEVPVMPNLSEADVSDVTTAASYAYNNAWGDGSGVDIVWGPNIVSGWAIIGMENISGAAGKDVLLQKEGGAWVVRDMGNGLMERWKGKTPAELWSTS